MEESSPLGRTTLDGLSEADWKDLWKRLRLYTYGNFGYKVLDRFILDEVILEAIEDTYFGNRRLPPDVNLTAFLCETIRSKISHYFDKEKKKVYLEEHYDNAQPVNFALENFHGNTSYPNLSKEDCHYDGIYFSELCDELREVVKSDPSLSKLVQLLSVEPGLKPRDIAKEMNQPPTFVYNLLKRLNRKARKLGLR